MNYEIITYIYIPNIIGSLSHIYIYIGSLNIKLPVLFYSTPFDFLHYTFLKTQGLRFYLQTCSSAHRRKMVIAATQYRAEATKTDGTTSPTFYVGLVVSVPFGSFLPTIIQSVSRCCLQLWEYLLLVASVACWMSHLPCQPGSILQNILISQVGRMGSGAFKRFLLIALHFVSSIN